MATLNLFDSLPPSRADEWHRIRAPGGYEWWEFEAHDPAQGIRVLLSFHDGFAFHPEYARRYDAYRRRPTLHHPPVPCQYPCVQCSVYENEVPLAKSTMHFPTGAFQADPAANALAVGAHRLKIGAVETIVQIDSADPAMSVELVFRDRSPSQPLEQALPCRQTAQAEHRWVLAQPLCEVEGGIRLGGRNIRFHGPGYHDHYYGAAPVDPFVRQWMRGRVISPDRSVAFHVMTEHASGLDQFIAVNADQTGVRALESIPFSINWNKRTLRGLVYPSAVQFGQSLILRSPRNIDSSATSMQLAFDAYVDGESCKAWAQIVYPSRLHKRPVHRELIDWLAGRQTKIFPVPSSVSR